MTPLRGEVWIVDLGLAAKVRPGLVVSVPASDSERALVTVVPYTTSPRGTRFEVASGVPFLHAGMFDAQNLVSIPHARLVRHIGRLLPARLVPVEDEVARWLGLELRKIA